MAYDADRDRTARDAAAENLEHEHPAKPEQTDDEGFEQGYDQHRDTPEEELEPNFARGISEEPPEGGLRAPNRPCRTGARPRAPGGPGDAPTWPRCDRRTASRSTVPWRARRPSRSRACGSFFDKVPDLVDLDHGRAPGRRRLGAVPTGVGSLIQRITLCAETPMCLPIAFIDRPVQ